MLVMSGSSLRAGEVTQNREVENFTGIDAREGIKVNIVRGEVESVKVTANPNDIDDLITEVKNGTLTIRWGSKISFRRHGAEVDIVANDLNRIITSSGASVKADTLQIEALVLAASSGSRINVASVGVSKIDVRSSSGSSVTVSGQAKSAEFDASSGARIKGGQLYADIAEVTASSGSSVSVYVDDNLAASASSGGSIRYGGKPQFSNVKASSGGSISKL